ncbi:dnaJ homolog subfamily C member 7 homolog [Palaemon carinicauda]|uniref:dnaJ homolog subfamily C member 7 homolog n=1 Tax=Palaemon carinicauda TaxID=392227 RepID=UPI0035B69BE6
MKEQEKKHEILSREMGEIKKIHEKIEKLQNNCFQKDLQMKEKEKKHEILSREMEEIKKIHNEKIEKLQNNCFQNDLQMKEKEKKQEILKTEIEEMEEFKKIHNKKIEELENDCVQKDLQIKDQDKLLEILKTGNALLHLLPAEANAASENPFDMNIILNSCQAIEKGLQGCRAYMLRGKHFLKLGLFDDAMKDFEAARMVKESEECLKFIEDAKVLKKKWESQSLYEVLGVGHTATRAEILNAFKGLAMKLHPDRHRDKPEFIQESFEEKFKKVVNAKTVLMDEQSRNEYNAEIPPPCPRKQLGQRDQRQQYRYYYNPAKAYYNQRKQRHRSPRKQKKTVFKDMFATFGKFFACN